jgi:hypothetical protein
MQKMITIPNWKAHMVNYKYIEIILKTNKFIVCLFLLLNSTQIFSKTNIINNICPKNKEVYFSCLTKERKFINICKNNDQGIQYLFGKPKKIELIHPLQANSANSDFSYANYFRPDVDYIELRFERNSAMYILHDYQSDESNDKRKSIGITVTNSLGKEVEFKCSKIFTNRLNQLKKIVPCDSESALGSKNCKQ